MAWDSIQTSADQIDPSEWNSQVLAIKYSANADKSWQNYDIKDVTMVSSTSFSGNILRVTTVSCSSYQGPATAGGTSTLNGLTIDVDKDWLGYDIDNVGMISANSMSGNILRVTTISCSTYNGPATNTAIGGSGANYGYHCNIYKDGETYKVQSGIDGTLLRSDTDFSTVFGPTISSASHIYIASGQYYMSSTHYIQSDTKIEGAGSSTDIILAPTLANSNAFVWGGVDGVDVYYSIFRDLQITLCEDFEGIVLYLLAYGPTSKSELANNTIENIRINSTDSHHSGTMLFLSASGGNNSNLWQNSFRNIQTDLDAIGDMIKMRATASPWCNGNYFEDIIGRRCQGMIDISGCNANTFTHIQMQTRPYSQYGMRIYAESNTFIGCKVWDWYKSSTNSIRENEIYLSENSLHNIIWPAGFRRTKSGSTYSTTFVDDGTRNLMYHFGNTGWFYAWKISCQEYDGPSTGGIDNIYDASDISGWDSGDFTNSGLIWNGSNWVAWKSGSGTGSPGGSDTQIQFNDSSSFGGDSNLTWDKDTDTLTVVGAIHSGTASRSKIFGGNAATNDLFLYANTNNLNSRIELLGRSHLNLRTSNDMYFYSGTTQMARFNFDGNNNFTYLYGPATPVTASFRIQANHWAQIPYFYMVGSGNIGVNNTSPEYLLDVSGSLHSLSVSSQAISGGTYIGDTITTTGRISSATGFYADWISGNTTNLGTAGNLSDLTIDVDKDWSGYDIDNIGMISANSMSGNILRVTTISCSSYQGPATNTAVGGSGQHYDYDYLIYKDGSTYYAQKGEDGTKPYSDTDCATVINSVVSAFTGSGSIEFADGVFDISGTVTVSGPVGFHGRGITRTSLRSRPAGTNTTLFAFSGTSGKAFGGGFEKLRLRGSVSDGGTLVIFNNIWKAYIRDCRISDNHGTSVYIRGSSYETYIVNCRLQSFTNQAILSDTTGGLELIENCDFAGRSDSIGVVHNAAGTVKLFANHFELASGVGGQHLQLNSGKVIAIGNSFASTRVQRNDMVRMMGGSGFNVINNNKFASAWGDCIFISSNAGNNTTIIGNSFDHFRRYAIEDQGQSNLLIEDNTFYDVTAPTSGVIYMANTQGGEVRGNAFYIRNYTGFAANNCRVFNDNMVSGCGGANAIQANNNYIIMLSANDTSGLRAKYANNNYIQHPIKGISNCEQAIGNYIISSQDYAIKIEYPSGIASNNIIKHCMSGIVVDSTAPYENINNNQIYDIQGGNSVYVEESGNPYSIWNNLNYGNSVISSSTGLYTDWVSGNSSNLTGTGDVSATGTPVAGEYARWTDATTIEGVDYFSGSAISGGVIKTNEIRSPTNSLIFYSGNDTTTQMMKISYGVGGGDPTPDDTNIYGGSAAGNDISVYPNTIQDKYFWSLTGTGRHSIVGRPNYTVPWLSFFTSSNSERIRVFGMFASGGSMDRTVVQGGDSAGWKLHLRGSNSSTEPYIEIADAGNIELHGTVTAVSSNNLSGQLMTFTTAKDITSWDAVNFTNSGIMWDGSAWVAMPSGGTGSMGGTLITNLDGASYTKGLDNMDFYSGQALSSATIKGTTTTMTNYISGVGLYVDFVSGNSTNFQGLSLAGAMTGHIDGASNVWALNDISAISANTLSGQIVTFTTAKDITSWDPVNFTNSGIMWDGDSWVAMPSGGTGSMGGNLISNLFGVNYTKGLDDMDFYSGQSISSNVILTKTIYGSGSSVPNITFDGTDIDFNVAHNQDFYWVDSTHGSMLQWWYDNGNVVTKIDGGVSSDDDLRIARNHSTQSPYVYWDANGIGINTTTPNEDLSVVGDISGQYITPIFRGAGKPAAAAGYEGKIIRTSGASGEGTWVWMCVFNSSDGYEWIQLGVST